MKISIFYWVWDDTAMNKTSARLEISSYLYNVSGKCLSSSWQTRARSWPAERPWLHPAGARGSATDYVLLLSTTSMSVLLQVSQAWHRQGRAEPALNSPLWRAQSSVTGGAGALGSCCQGRAIAGWNHLPWWVCGWTAGFSRHLGHCWFPHRLGHVLSAACRGSCLPRARL